MTLPATSTINYLISFVLSNGGVFLLDMSDKLRVLYVAKILYEETDAEHPLKTSQLLTALQEKYHITAHRTTIPGDIDLLRQAGLNINVRKSSQIQYCIADRSFSIPELQLLIDAVDSARFLTKAKSNLLAEKLTALAGKYHGEDMKRNMHTSGSLKKDNEQIYTIVNAVNKAINEKRKISFLYFSYTVRKEKKLRNDGNRYIFSPYSLIWNGDYYYMIGWSEKHQNIAVFRLDRVADTPFILADDAVQTPDSFDITEYTDTMFHMFNSERRAVELICDNSMMDNILDKFGLDVTTFANDMDSFRVVANVAVSHIFFGWVFGTGGKVKIKAPEDVKEAYKRMVLDEAVKL